MPKNTLLSDYAISKMDLVQLNLYIGKYQAELNANIKEMQDLLKKGSKSEQKMAEEGLHYLSGRAGKINQAKGINGGADKFNIPYMAQLEEARRKLKALRNTLQASHSSIVNIKASLNAMKISLNKNLELDLKFEEIMTYNEIMELGREYNIPSAVAAELFRHTIGDIRSGRVSVEEVIDFMRGQLSQDNYSYDALTDDYDYWIKHEV